MKYQSKIHTMTEAEEKLQFYLDNIMDFAHKFAKNEEERVLLAGAMMGAAKIMYQANLTPEQFDEILDHNGKDLINFIKPTIH